MGVLTYLFCLFSVVPGPPGFSFNGGWFQALPVSPCDGVNSIDPTQDVIFQLYQGNDSRTHRKLLAEDDSLMRVSGFDPQFPTVVYIHGFLDSPEAEEVEVMKQAYATRGGHNFIVVGWRRLAAGPWYEAALANVVPVGQYTAKFLDQLENSSGPLKSLHVIGHSLGAHIAGVAANSTKVAKVTRITGLDPALPWINTTNLEETLDRNDAPFVDIIHTDGDNFGLSIPLGHVDFYPNGGRAQQPGCGLLDTPTSLNFLGRVFCSHRRSYWLYAATVVRELSFMATPCDSWDNFQAGSCNDDSDQRIPMGYAVPTSARGKFYTKINAIPPY